MKKKVLIVLGFIFVILLIIYLSWSAKNTATLSYTTEEGEEKTLVIPAVPGVEKQGEEILNCSHRVAYDIAISQVPPLEASPQIKEIIKPRFQQEGWVVEEEKRVDGFWVVIFTKDQEKLTAQTGAKGDLPTVELLYEWPPCSQEN